MMEKKIIYILNGPNLNLLGERETDIYGDISLNDIESELISLAEKKNIELIIRQTNHEGELIDFVHEASKKGSGIIINPAGYTHTSIALLDSLLACKIPKVEVHLSNIYKREEFRHNSYISKAVDSVISGLGIDGYKFALEHLLKSIG